MAAFFLLRMGVLLKDEALIDDALNQYYWHIKYLQGLVLQKHAHPQQEEARHKERVCPRLLGKVVVDRDGVMQNMIPEAQRLLLDVYKRQVLC